MYVLTRAYTYISYFKIAEEPELTHKKFSGGRSDVWRRTMVCSVVWQKKEDPAHERRSSTEEVLPFPRTALWSRRWARQYHLQGRPVAHLRRPVGCVLLSCPTRHLRNRKSRRKDRCGLQERRDAGTEGRLV